MPAVKDFIDQEKISLFGAEKIKDRMTIMTFCYSKTVLAIFKKAFAQGKKFTVRISETRPNLTGRMMAKELVKNAIPVIYTVDLANLENLQKSQLFLLGTDCITTDGFVINKKGTALLVQLSQLTKTPTYICTSLSKIKSANSKNLALKKRKSGEIWKNPPKGINPINPAYDITPINTVTGFISELGILKPSVFMRKISTFHSGTI